MLHWKCIKNCGACCYLAPDERVEALESLDDKQTEIYLKMVGKNGWCTNYDSVSRTCMIYDNRPDFCNVHNLGDFYDFNHVLPDTYAINCCRQHIKSIYGKSSLELMTFEKEIRTTVQQINE